MGENTYFFNWAEKLVDTIVTSICEVISKEGGSNPVPIVEGEFEKLPLEKKFLLQYVAALCWGEKNGSNYEALAKQSILDVWLALNLKP